MKLGILEDVPSLRNVHSRYGATENNFLRGKTLLQNKSLWRHRFDPWVGKIPWSRKWQHAPVFLPGKSHGQKSLASYSPWGCKESDTIEHTPITGSLMMRLFFLLQLDKGKTLLDSSLLFMSFLIDRDLPPLWLGHSLTQ